VSAPQLIPVLAQHRFDEARLEAWLRLHLDGFAGLQSVQQFQGGQSNPTFLLQGPGGPLVLRKKPPGTLLASAHAVEREYAAMKALQHSAVPVPRMRLLCEDAQVIGTPFFLMEHVPGRVFAHPAVSDAAPGERRPLYLAMVRTLAALHAVDWRGAGLGAFGRPESYLARQVARWSRQYAASKVPSPAMDELTRWVGAHVPASDASGAEGTLAHGDFRLGNLIFDAAQPQVRAVLDWELSTIGHPLADLAYSCLAFRVGPELNGVLGIDDPALPTEGELVEAYCQAAGRTRPADFEFFVAFSMFRWAAILAGVYRRALDGNAADARALDTGRRFLAVAEAGWQVALRA